MIIPSFCDDLESKTRKFSMSNPFLSLPYSGCPSREQRLHSTQIFPLRVATFLPLCAAQMIASNGSCLLTETFLLLSYLVTSAPLPLPPHWHTKVSICYQRLTSMTTQRGSSSEPEGVLEEVIKCENKQTRIKTKKYKRQRKWEETMERRDTNAGLKGKDENGKRYLKDE